eukprot:41562_1
MTSCEPTRFALTISFVIICGILTIIAYFIMYNFIKYIFCTPNPASKVPNKIIVNSGIVLYMIILIALPIQVGTVLDICLRGYVHDILFVSFNEAYTLQASALLMVWFIRLYYVFRSSRFALSSYTKMVYISIFILGLIFTTIITVHLGPQEGLWLILVQFAYLLYVILVIILSSLFVNKLCRVYRNVDVAAKSNKRSKERYKLIAVVTKISVLNFGSLTITILAAITIIFFIHGNVYAEFIAHFAVFADIFTNFLCVILSYNNYKRFYHIVCGCCHNQCITCCAERKTADELRKKLEESGTSLKTRDMDKTASGGIESKTKSNSELPTQTKMSIMKSETIMTQTIQDKDISTQIKPDLSIQTAPVSQ